MHTNRAVTHRMLPVLVLVAAVLVALVPALAPAETQAGAIVVAEVDGTVEARTGEDGEWRTVEVGDELPLGTEISTGFKSTLVLNMGDHTKITVTALTQIRLEEFARVDEEGVIRTRLDLKLGGVHYDVHSPEGMKTDFSVKTPNATASVSGSGGGVSNSPGFGTRGWSTENRLNVNTRRHGNTQIGPGQETDGSKNGVAYGKDKRNSGRKRPGMTGDEKGSVGETTGDNTGGDNVDDRASNRGLNRGSQAQKEDDVIEDEDKPGGGGGGY